MPHYIYEALTNTGERIKDEGEYPSVGALYQDLRQRGLTLLDYKKKFSFDLSFIPQKIKRPILAEFFRNLSLLIRGGVPIKQAIEDLYKSPGDPALKKALGKILKRIDEGQLLSEAMKEQPRVFGKIVLVLVTIGEETGSLDRTLEDAATHIERVEEIISNTKRAITYPAFVATAMTGALIFWMLYVLPQILSLFTGLGMKNLPQTTKLLIVSVDIFKVYWQVIPLSVFALLILYIVSKKNDRLKYYWDLMWSYMPILGNVLKASQLAFFFEYLALLTKAGIDIVRSLEIMEKSVSHQVLKRAINSVRMDVMDGNGLTESFSKIKLFEPFILRMIGVGEQTGDMPGQLQILARFYLDKVNKLVDAMAKTLEPALIVVSGLIFVIIALGLLGPIYELMGKIQ
ncbi:Type II secretory pathway, component PulF [Dissulfuribacter thermophilus]|uniref:Type II secretory pathway, component PulF n=1 Tax=Dissulfuribacter thermophilus TaxID=1156395 RepID=A0A1B9F5E3_9BACT|nr:type II secretion system F family protein [Dissulfuribacter thermophilus]OCC15093.1 Type II secretory pathway, component PulF [Dissulfuribacter thermophilus]